MTWKFAGSTRRIAALFAAVCALTAALAAAAPEGREWFDLDEKALVDLDFEHLRLPDDPAQVRQKFPGARRDRERVDEQIGLECYEVRELANADLARFYFCDGRLYQLEIVYDLPRVKQLGGMRSLVQRLVDTWGPADHAGESRWTWQRPMYVRRADFYAWPDSAQLTITDMSWMPIVSQRLERAERQHPADLGL